MKKHMCCCPLGPLDQHKHVCLLRICKSVLGPPKMQWCQCICEPLGKKVFVFCSVCFAYVIAGPWQQNCSYRMLSHPVKQNIRFELVLPSWLDRIVKPMVLLHCWAIGSSKNMCAYRVFWPMLWETNETPLVLLHVWAIASTTKTQLKRTNDK